MEGDLENGFAARLRSWHCPRSDCFGVSVAARQSRSTTLPGKQEEPWLNFRSIQIVALSLVF